MTRKQEQVLWRSVAELVDRYDSDRIGMGLCYALHQSDLNGEQLQDQEARLFKHAPRGTFKYWYWWPLTKAGDAARLAVCRKLAHDAPVKRAKKKGKAKK